MIRLSVCNQDVTRVCLQRASGHVLNETSVPGPTTNVWVPLVHERLFQGASEGHSMPVLLPSSGGP